MTDVPDATDSDPDLTSADLVLLLAAASAGVNEQVAARMREDGVSQVRPHHGYLFQHLLVGPRTVRELASLMAVTPQAVSKTVGEMETLGWVVRRVGTQDSRTREVALTPAGLAVVEAGRRSRHRAEQDLRTALGDDAVARLRACLSHIASATGGWEMLSRRALPTGEQGRPVQA